jgi:hypothetical protein
VQLVESDNKPLESSTEVVIFIDGYMQEYGADTAGETPKTSHKGKQFSPTYSSILVIALRFIWVSCKFDSVW